MTNKEKFIIETVAYNTRKRLIDNKIIDDKKSFSIEDIREIVQFFGGQLSFREDANTKIEKNSENSFTIIYSTNTKALDFFHELGHAFFDLPTMKINTTKDCDGFESSDIRAAFFARCLLMPRESFESVVISHSGDGKCDIRLVAEEFQVDYLSVLTRGEELNIWR